MLRRILSISGRPGLYRLVSQGKNMLIVESLLDGKRMPAHARDKVSSLGDISIYVEGDDAKPLSEVLEQLKGVADGKAVDVKAMSDGEVREYFAKVLPEFDQDMVHTADIRKLISWYNLLLKAGITEFVETEEAEQSSEE